MHPSSRLHRLDNTLWAYTPPPLSELTRIQIQTPIFTEKDLAYTLVEATHTLFTNRHITKKADFDKNLTITIVNENPALSGSWSVVLEKQNSILARILQFFPITTTYPNRRIVRVQLKKIETKVHALAHAELMPETVPYDPSRVYQGQAFADPFTRLASMHFQTSCPYFVSEQKVQDCSRFVLKKGILTLEPLKDGPSEQEENRVTVKAYQDFIISEFSLEKLQYVNAAYGFSLDELIKTGEPLLPDHVFKTNIGMCNIEISDLQTTLEALSLDTPLPNRLHKALMHLPRASYDKLKNAVKAHNGPVTQLPVEPFNILASLVMPNSGDRERAYTGRKIRHLAVQGCNTMGNMNIFNPSRDQFELMHVFDQMQKTDDWENYYQLLSHVASKKSLFRKTAPEMLKAGDRHWHVGVLLPAPKALDGSARWYYNTGFYDDGQGNVNYALMPACENYRFDNKPLPFIKNYRSTASDHNAIDWLTTIAADLNPYGSPGSIDPSDSFNQEKREFFERTIPLWVAKLLYAHQTKELSSYKEALIEYQRCLNAPGATPECKHHELTKLLQSTNIDEISSFLHTEAEFHKELPKYKRDQDILCIGHSLGGALAQFNAYYYLPRRRRIPLANRTLVCYSSRGPAINNDQDAAFMQFGRENSDLLQAMNQKWKVIHDFEYGDFVPESGHSHLGTTAYTEKDTKWLDVQSHVFRPLETANALEITTLPTHARRPKVCVPGVDYTQTPISPETLRQYDHNWIMTSELVNLFGYRLLRSSKITEGVREIAAIITRPFMILAEAINNYLFPPIGRRNATGGLFLFHHWGQA